MVLGGAGACMVTVLGSLSFSQQGKLICLLSAIDGMEYIGDEWAGGWVKGKEKGSCRW